MNALQRGEVWLVDLGMAAKTRPAMVISIPAADVDRALVTIVPYTTSALWLGRALEQAKGIEVKTQAFQELMSSVRQAGRVRFGEMKPGRTTVFKQADVKAIRSSLRRVSERVRAHDRRECRHVADLGAGQALRMARRSRSCALPPKAVAEALHGKKRGPPDDAAN